MFEFTHTNKLCVSASWLYEESKILTKSNYDSLVQREKMKRVNVGGNGRRALVVYDSIPDRFKEKIQEVIGGDPYEKVKHLYFIDYIKPDHKAEEFYRNYTLEDGTALPEPNQIEYTHSAMILNTCHHIVTNLVTARKFGGKTKAWKRMAEAISNLPEHTYKHKLPRNERRLKQRYNEFQKNGFEALIHGNFLNTSAQKLSEEATRWVLSRWCNQVNRCANLMQLHAEYNEYADANGWAHVKSEKTFYNYLYSEEIQPLWYGHRYGELAAKEKFDYQFKTKMPRFRDSLWYSDGTKLNYYYKDENGKTQTCQVYEVMDAFSEVFLGYFISKTEDFQAQYSAFKMAVQIAGFRPYQVSFDNQGGHKRLEAGNFLSKISRIQTATQPYNAKSKTIESAFGRFQSQYLKRDWFFTGQNITAKKKESAANMEFILANADSLPTLDEIKATYAQRRKEWNEAPHHKTGIPRIEMYMQSKNPDTKEVNIWDMVDLFWITRNKTIKADAQGISFTEKKVEYSYMVYTQDGMPDLNWLSKSVGKSFIVKFDPEDMTMIHLYEDTPLGARFVTEATTKVEVERAIQLQDDWEASHIKTVINQVKNVRIERRDKTEEILSQFGMTAEQQGLKRPTLKGIERNKRGRKKSNGEDIGQYQKKLSNQDWSDDPELVEVDKIDISKLL